MVCSYSNARLPDGGAWFCLRTHFKRKHIAAGYTESMFSSILFARLDYRAFHREIRQRPAVSGFVQFGERLALLPDALISEFRTRTGLDEIVEVGRAFEPGQEVEITQGPFRRLKTLVTSTHHGSRAHRPSHRMDGPHPACRSGRHRSGALGARCRMLSKNLMTAIHLNEPILTGKRPLITSNSRGPKSTQNMCDLFAHMG